VRFFFKECTNETEDSHFGDFIGQWGHLAALPDKNALPLADRTANVKRLVQIIRIFEGLPKAPQPEQPKSS